MFDFSDVTTPLHAFLSRLLGESLAVVTECVLVAVALISIYAVFAMIMIYAERKVCAAFQCRIGPDRVGKWGWLQVISDVLKMMTKEVINLRQTDRFLHRIAPFLVVTASMTTFACLPWNKGAQIIDFNVGVFFFLAVGSVGVVGILLAGWSSNNKYSLIGAMRSGAQIISYELSIGMVMLTMICLTGTMSFSEICQQQADLGWNIFRGHIIALPAFIIYLIAGNAECNRGPFDLPESESELTAGYHTEYSGMDFGYYYLAEYLNIVVCAGIAATIFLGGWAPFVVPGLDGFNEVMSMIPGFVWFVGKTFFVIGLLLWQRWTFPRLRIDQILTLEWKYLIPISMTLLIGMALLVSFGLTF
ncbi:NADH-quinone oxidoreductase subunit H [Alloprevotella sp. OH1205_COT-284]|uniref:complex I subunit 1/NuoH family protein n=1 Tax=Alloprevotella sp. OH1205_COT-284 TaxID=2491043 RepID=UPI000F5FEFC3|nr:complex I subunit 1 family protein [Alloprevotella sp. OH1205_COT-284]RRD80336.1 NADH-quinone oxidoreductase subunit H [Alloprevotella sp. OH1205_COT-284]